MNRLSRLTWLVLTSALLMSVPPTLADDYLVYTEGGIPKDSVIWIWCGEDPSSQGLCPFFSERLNQCANPEGNRHLNVPSNSWAGFGVFFVDEQLPPQNTLWEDLSAFADGEVRFFAKSAVIDFTVEMQCHAIGGDPASARGYNSIENVLGIWGADFGPSPDWQEVVIPVRAFVGNNGLTCNGGTQNGAPCATDGDCTNGTCDEVNFNTCLQHVNAPFLATMGTGPSSFAIDNVRWRTPNSHSGASSVTVQGRQLEVNGQPFVVNGVAYTPHSIGENYTGALRDRPELYAVDFPAIAASGANVLRIYSSFLTTAMLDAALANGLYVMPTFEVDPVQFGCEVGRNHTRDRFLDTVQQWGDHPAILAWFIGNEVQNGLPQPELCDAGTCSVSGGGCATDAVCPSGLCNLDGTTVCDPVTQNCPLLGGVSQTCVAETCSKGWFASFKELADAAAAANPTIQPMGTSNADLGNIGVAGCSDDATLNNVDFWGANFYRGCTFADAFSSFQSLSSKPLLIAEFGSDAWNAGIGMEDQTMQETCVADLLAEADSALAVRDPVNGVSTGQVLFSWKDEWWKDFDGGSCLNTYWDKHDTCTSWVQFGYPVDEEIQEEWWGLARRDTYCTGGTIPCVTDDDCPGAPGSCSIAGTSCRIDSECPGVCSTDAGISCFVDTDCPGLCSGNPPTQCTSNADCAGVQECIFGTSRCDHETCNQSACNVEPDPTAIVTRSAYDAMANTYRLGAVVDLNVALYDEGTGVADITFNPAPGSMDHALYYGPLSAVSTYGYTGTEGPLGASGSSSVSLPGGSLFYVVVGQNGLEGCYGVNSACVERPGFGAPQDPDLDCSVPQCP